MRISPIGLAAWGLAGGMTAAAVRQWTPEGPEQVLGLSLASVAAWRLVRAAGRAVARAARARAPRPVPAPPAWPAPYGQQPGKLRFPARSSSTLPLRRAAAAVALSGLVGSWVGAYRIAQLAAALRPFEDGCVAWVGGFVAAPPQRTAYTVRLTLHPAALSTTAGRLPQGPWTPLPGAVQVEVPRESFPALALQTVPGGWVAARGLVKLPEEAAYPGAFSPRRYLNARGVVLAVRVRSPDRILSGAPPAPPSPASMARSTMLRAGMAVSDRIRQRMGPAASRWLRAVGLGQREALSPSQQEALQAAGLGHLLSVSGVHVGLVAGPLVALARRTSGSRRAARRAMAAVAVAAGWLYAAMTGMSAPAVRASLVQTVALAVWAAGKRAALVSSLGVAAAVQLLTGSPHLGSDPGFQMSYAATLGIGLFLLAVDGPTREGPSVCGNARPLRMLQAACRRTLVALGISLSAWASVSPLVMAYFGRASMVGAVMSVPAAPLCGLLLWSGLLALVGPAPLSGAAAWVAERAAAALEWLALAGQSLDLRWGAQLPIQIWVLPAAAGIVLLLALRQQSTYGRWRAAARGAAVLAGAALLLVEAPAGPHAGSLLSAPAGQGWVAAGVGPNGTAWLVVKLRDGQEVESVVYKTAGILAGLGRFRADLAVAASPGPGEGGAPTLPAALARFSRVWVLAGEDGALELALPGTGEGRRAATVVFGDLRLVAETGAPGRFRIEMGGPFSVEFHLEAACLRPAWSQRAVCRRDGAVYQSVWEAEVGEPLQP